MTIYKIEEIFEGVAFLEYFGSLYEYAGMKNGKYCFQCVDSNSRIEVSYENLVNSKDFDICY